MDTLKRKYPSDRFHPVLISEVTRMQGGFFCVAGWDVHEGRMVRPLHPTGQNWRGRGEQPPFEVGEVIDCLYAGREHGTPPHSQEDSVLQRTPRALETVDEAKLHELLHPTVDGSVPAIFGRRLVDEQYLVDGVRCRSLGAVAAARGMMGFVERFGKLRFRFRDSDGTYYDFPVTCETLLRDFSPGDGAGEPRAAHDAANQWLEIIPETQPIILRIGVSRGYAGKANEYNPKRCFAQLNGVIRPITR